MAEEKETKNPVQSAERIFQVMEMLAENGEMGLMEISAALGLHKSTVHRLLMSLVYMGYARQDEVSQKYMLSYKIVNMAGKILERMDVLQVAKPYLERLSDLSGEAVHLVQREGNQILYIYKIEAKVGTIRMVSHVGMIHPMYCSGVGKAIMATLPEREVKQIWNESVIEKKTDKTITDYDEMLKVLEEVRINGYALDDEENEKGGTCDTIRVLFVEDPALFHEIVPSLCTSLKGVVFTLDAGKQSDQFFRRVAYDAVDIHQALVRVIDHATDMRIGLSQSEERGAAPEKGFHIGFHFPDILRQ